MNTSRNSPIGVFDSGIGGLTVMRGIVDALPEEHVIYLGDTARVPYGNRASETVRRYALNASRLLLQRDIKALVVACNTATAHALPALRERVDVPVVGVVRPVARRAAEVTDSGHIGVLGTRGTVRSGSYPEAVAAVDETLTVHQVPSPLLVPLAEEGWTDGSVVREVIAHYLEDLAGTAVDTIILGCTHYPILRPAIEDMAADLLGGSMRLLDSARATAAALRGVLDEEGLLRSTAAPGPHDFLLTDLSPTFVETAERFFGTRPEHIDHVDIVDTTA